MCPTYLLWHNSSLVRGQHRAVMVMRWCSTNHHQINPLNKLPNVQSASATLPMTPPTPQATSAGGQQIDWASKIAEVMRDQFGLKPKQQNLMYRTLYPAAYDQLPLPHKYKLPDFTKFFGQGKVSTVEHINRFIIQCGEAAQNDALKVQLFSMSLSGSAFTWFTTLPANSIIYWADLEK